MLTRRTSPLIMLFLFSLFWSFTARAAVTASTPVLTIQGGRAVRAPASEVVGAGAVTQIINALGIQRPVSSGGQLAIGAENTSAVAIIPPVTAARDIEISNTDTNGNAGERNEYKGLFRLKMVGLGQGVNGTTETTSYVDDSPAGEWAPIDADVTEAESTTVYKFGAKSYAATFAATAAADDGFKRSITSDNLEANESVGLWVYSSVLITAGSLNLVLTDDGGVRIYNLGQIPATTWTWIELDVSALTGGTGDAITEVGVVLTEAGATALGAFTLYLDAAYKWDADAEDALANAILQDGVLSIVNTETGATLTEGTDFFVHYETGNDFVVWMTDQSTADAVALIAY